MISQVLSPSPYEGKISQLKVKIGDKVSEGSILATLDGGNEKKEEVAKPTKEIIEVEEQTIPKMEKTNGLRNGKETIYAQPISKDDIDPAETQEWLESVSYTHLTLPTN